MSYFTTVATLERESDTISQIRHSGKILAGVVVHGCTVNESKDEIHVSTKSGFVA